MSLSSTQRLRLFGLAMCLHFAAPTFSQQVSLVKDLNETFSSNSNPARGATIGSINVFTAFQPYQGTELWRTDGTEGGTTMIKDINPGIESSTPSGFRLVGNVLYFTAISPGYGTELWKTDGTAEGTVLVKDIFAGQQSASILIFGDLNNEVYFLADDGIRGLEVWKSNGTESGTVLVKDIIAGAIGSTRISNTSAILNGKLYFNYYDPLAGTDLYVTDGTASGTLRVKDFEGSGDVAEPFSFNGTLFFRASTPATASELWKSDGTEAGTVQVADISAGTSNGSPTNFAVYNNILLFSAFGPTGRDIYKTDGTEAGTVLVKDVNSNFAAANVIWMGQVSDGLLFVGADAATGSELWKTDGTLAGTVLVKDINPGAAGGASSFGGTIGNTSYFFGIDPTHGLELWKSDGTTAGTVLVRDIREFSPSSIPSFSIGAFSVASLGIISDVFLFRATDPDRGDELFKSSGTTETTVLVKDIAEEGYTSNGALTVMLPVGNTLYFGGSDVTYAQEMWKTDGTEAGTSILKDLNLGLGNGYLPNLSSPNTVVLNGKLFFAANTPTQKLVVSDGTEAGTVFVPSVPQSTSSFINMVASGNHVFFRGFGANGQELWAATETSLVEVKDINVGVFNGVQNNEMVDVNGTLFFTAFDGTSRQLWKSNGTPEGTVLVANVEGPSNGYAGSLTPVGSALYFIATDGANGMELWKSDGTPSGTAMVKDIAPGAESAQIGNLLNVNGVLYFSANDGTGNELWRTDGTQAGTTRVADINPGAGSGFPNTFALGATAGTFYFMANDGAHGNELWKSDGTTAGTSMVKDMQEGAAGSTVQYIRSAGGLTFFYALGDGIYRTDGTAAGTLLLSDQVSIRTPFHQANNYLFFQGYTPYNGLELHTINLSFPILEVTSEGALIAEDSEIDFGNVAVNSTMTKTFTLKNKGNADLEILEYEWEDDMPTEFEFINTNPDPTIVPPGQSVTVQVTIKPSAIGEQIGYLGLTTDDEAYHVFSLVFKANVVKADQQISFTATDKTFGDAAFTLTATSTSTLPVTFSSTSSTVVVNGTSVSIVQPGKATITATQAGDQNYNATLAIQTFCINPAKPLVTKGDQVFEEVTLLSSNANGNQWFYNGTAISGATSQNYTVAEDKQGSYTVQTTVEGCASALSDAATVLITGVESDDANWSIYPNPAKDYLVIENHTSKNMQIAITNTQGKVIHEQVSGKSNTSVDIKTYQKGMYIVRLRGHSTDKYFKFVKE